MRGFRNLPTATPKTEISETKVSWVWPSFWAGFKILLVLVVLGFLGWKIFILGENVVKTRGELLFAISHPDMVKPIRVLYEKSHEQADVDLRQILTGGK